MWDIDFISKDNFRKHVKETIEKYGEKLKWKSKMIVLIGL